MKKHSCFLWIIALLALVMTAANGALAEHEHEYADRDNGDGTHSFMCVQCGDRLTTEEHVAYCIDPGHCRDCGAVIDGSFRLIHYDTNIVDNGDGTHREKCEYCDYEGECLPHIADCSRPDHCIQCLAQIPVPEELSHAGRYCSDNGDGTHTWRCDRCGFGFYAEPHIVYCDNPRLCWTCFAEVSVSQDEMRHHFVGIDNGNGTHTLTCDTCGYVDAAGIHQLVIGEDEDVCGVCGVDSGLMMYQGQLFLVDKGRIMTDVNGLNLLDKWYYFAAGQVQKQYTGVVSYDGAWFYVTNGRMDTASNGLYDYDGSKFLVSAGQVRYDYSGLFQNAAAGLHNADGKWYFIANGQVQTQYTGLAQYDGHWFYLVNGVLAEDYTGEVSYDGSVFNVVNGMVQ